MGGRIRLPNFFCPGICGSHRSGIAGLTLSAVLVGFGLCLVSCKPGIVIVPSTALPQKSTIDNPGQTQTSTSVAATKTSIPIFQPAPGMLWQWQLSTPPDMSIDAQVYDIDLFDNNEKVISALHKRGAKVVCYISAGTYEDWRPDAGKFPKVIIGKLDTGWPGERWLDIRRVDTLSPIILGRMDLCKAKGFDGLEPDNIDAFTNDAGFPLTAADQLKYNLWLAQQAHARGLSIGLKNDGLQAAALVKVFDWALTEECFIYTECELMNPFLEAGKQVVDTEYTDTGISPANICPQALKLGLDVIFKDRALTAYRKTCS